MNKNFELNTAAQNTVKTATTQNIVAVPAKKKTRNTIECKVIHKDNTIVLTKRFATAASKPGTKEFKELAKTRQMFPTYEVVARTASPSAKRVSMKGLSYDFMEEHITLLHEADLPTYTQQKRLSKAYKNPYMYMRKWFVETYPNWADYVVQNTEEVGA